MEHTQQIKQEHGAVCLDRMEKFTYAPETASSTAGGGGGARAARAASGARAGAGQGGGLRSRGGDASTSGRLDAPRRTGAWVAGSNSKFTTFGNTNTDCTFQGGVPPNSLVCRTMDWPLSKMDCCKSIVCTATAPVQMLGTAICQVHLGDVDLGAWLCCMFDHKLFSALKIDLRHFKGVASGKHCGDGMLCCIGISICRSDCM